MSVTDDRRYDRGLVPFGIYDSSQDSERLARDVTLFERELRDAKRFQRKVEELVRRVEALEQSLKNRKLANLARPKRPPQPNKRGIHDRRITTEHIR